MTADFRDRASLRRYAWLSIAAALATMGLKGVAYFLTGSVGLLSDAIESLVNLVGALMALWMLTVAAREPDEEHAYGHTKAEYFSSGVEGSLILVAAISIGTAAVGRLLAPRPLEQLGVGPCGVGHRLAREPGRGARAPARRPPVRLGDPRAPARTTCSPTCGRPPASLPASAWWP